MLYKNKLLPIYTSINVAKTNKKLFNNTISNNIDISNNIYEDKNLIHITNLAIKDALILSNYYMKNIIYNEIKNFTLISNDYYDVLNNSITSMKSINNIILLLDKTNAQFDVFETAIYILNKNNNDIVIFKNLYNIIINFKDIIQLALIIFLENIIKISILTNEIYSILVKFYNKPLDKIDKIIIKKNDLIILNDIILNINITIDIIYNIQKNIEDNMIVLLYNKDLDDLDNIMEIIINNNNSNMTKLDEHINNINNNINVLLL